MLLHSIPREIITRIDPADIFSIRIGEVCKQCFDIIESKWEHFDCAVDFLGSKELDTYYCECICYNEAGVYIHLFAVSESEDLICNPCYKGKCPS